MERRFAEGEDAAAETGHPVAAPVRGGRHGGRGELRRRDVSRRRDGGRSRLSAHQRQESRSYEQSCRRTKSSEPFMGIIPVNHCRYMRTIGNQEFLRFG
jgi:hypothetical protein